MLSSGLILWDIGKYYEEKEEYVAAPIMNILKKNQ